MSEVFMHKLQVITTVVVLAIVCWGSATTNIINSIKRKGVPLL
jgi:hypothetical protein